MHLKLQTDYALRVLLWLAATRRQSTVDELAGAFRVSREHLVKIVQELARAGLVATRAGRGGGVHLAREPHEVRVADVVARFEGRDAVVGCLTDPDACGLHPGCDLRRLLRDAERAFYDTLGGSTLADLAASSRKALARVGAQP